jgi:hypothetical protein
VGWVRPLALRQVREYSAAVHSSALHLCRVAAAAAHRLLAQRPD